MTGLEKLCQLFENVPLPDEQVGKGGGRIVETPAVAEEENPVAGAAVPINQNGVMPGPDKLLQFREACRITNTPRLYDTREESDPLVRFKLFDPCGAGTWFVLEWDGITNEIYCWATLGDPSCAELGYSSLDEMAYVKGRLGIGIEIDNWFSPIPLSQAKESLYGKPKSEDAHPV